jgi:hypothetical protein
MKMNKTPYIETFDHGPGGWLAQALTGGATLPDLRDGVISCRSPWWVDYNHAPPGAGYLHLLIFLHTRAGLVPELGGPNRFVRAGQSRDLTNARLTVRLRGEVDLRGAEMLLLAQADVPGTRTNFVLTGQPFRITPEWSEQTVTLVPDPDQWLCLGSRHDRTATYGYGDIADVLRDLNVDIIFVLFPLTIVPVGEVADLHFLQAGVDYEVDARYLPQGEVQFDTVRIEYAESDE